MSAGIIFNGGNSGSGNPYALGVNLPAPIIIKRKGNQKTTNSGTMDSIFKHGSNYVENQPENQSILQAYLPNARYSGYNNLGGQVPNAIWDKINALNPYIFMFHWKRSVSGAGSGTNKSHRNYQIPKNGAWVHPINILSGVNEALYTNFGRNGINWPKSYAGGLPEGAINDINAKSEWNLGQSQNVIDLKNLNPFRYYTNNEANFNVASQYFNTDRNFFVADGRTFLEWNESRVRTKANNKGIYGNSYYSVRQSDYNVYLAFALVIQNPENTSQYIVGPLSNIVKQSLVMGIDGSNNKIAKGFKYLV